MKIGFYDSGLGGLTVLKEALTKMPNHHFIYYGDTKNVPYGEKSTNEVISYANKAAKYLIDKGVECIVIACNTASCAAGEVLKKEINIPVICMAPAIEIAMKNNPNKKRILVLATNLTLKSEKYKAMKNKLKKELIDELAAPKLVEFAEQFKMDDRKVREYIEQMLSSYDFNNYSYIVLGCTHFTFFKDIIERMIPKEVQVIDGNISTIDKVLPLIDIKEKKLTKTRIDIHLTAGCNKKLYRRICDYLHI